MTFDARYHSTCGSCGEHVNPDDSVDWVDDEIVHTICVDRPTPAPAVVCGECWMTKPCWCDPDTEETP